MRALILTGTGERAFSAGADVHEIAESVKRGVKTVIGDFVRRDQALTRRIEFYPKPINVAVNGLAFGGGCEITEAAQLSVASENAIFRETGNSSGHAADLWPHPATPPTGRPETGS